MFVPIRRIRITIFLSINRVVKGGEFLSGSIAEYSVDAEESALSETGRSTGLKEGQRCTRLDYAQSAVAELCKITGHKILFNRPASKSEIKRGIFLENSEYLCGC